MHPFDVAVCDAGHPFTRGIAPFTVRDELHLSEYRPPLTPLLQTRFTGTFGGSYRDRDWPTDDPRLVAYHKPWGVDGGVLYYTLGHCHGRWDLRPVVDDAGQVERGAWTLDVHTELLRRGLRWAARIDDWGNS